MKIGINSIVLPPSSSGQAIALYNLLKELPSELFFFISQKKYGTPQQSDATERLNTRYHQIKRAPSLFERLLHHLFFRGYFNPLLWYIKVISWEIKIILKKEKANAIIACTADVLEPISSYFAARLMKIPYILYAFDDYGSQWIDPINKFIANVYAPMIIQDASIVIVPNEFLQEYYQQKYKIQPVVIHNPIDLRPYTTEKIDHFRIGTDQIKIIYTGAVYEAHYAAFLNLIQAISRLPDLNIQLHIYTDISKEKLIARGIKGPVEYHPYKKMSDIAFIQLSADILFLPLAESSEYSEVIAKTSSPMKMGEYLATGVPILVHAPFDSYLSYYFTRYKCGIVVDHQNAESLAQGIRELIFNAKLRNEIAKNARERAKIDFSLGTNKELFMNLLERVVNNPQF